MVVYKHIVKSNQALNENRRKTKTQEHFISTVLLLAMQGSSEYNIHCGYASLEDSYMHA